MTVFAERFFDFHCSAGEAISQLISGYIDIILKKKKDIGRVEREDDSMVPHEEMVAPIMAAAVTTMTSTIGLVRLLRSQFAGCDPQLKLVLSTLLWWWWWWRHRVAMPVVKRARASSDRRSRSLECRALARRCGHDPSSSLARSRSFFSSVLPSVLS